MIKDLADLNRANREFYRDGTFEPAKHPRDPDGKFGTGAGSGTPAAATPSAPPLGEKKEFSGGPTAYRSWYNFVWGAFPKLGSHTNNDHFETMKNAHGQTVAQWDKRNGNGYIYLHAAGSNSPYAPQV